MSKHRRFWALLAIAVAVLGGLASAFLSGGPRRVNRKNFDRIEVGMTREQVGALLGAEYGSLEPLGNEHLGYYTERYYTPLGERWTLVVVTYDQYRVAGKRFEDTTGGAWWEWVRYRLGL
jgi:hypothetical protein